VKYEIVPESAPFSSEQRAWLNGFLAGMLGSLDAESTRSGSEVSLAAAAAMLPPLSGSSESLAAEDFPWHDSTLATAERMALAEGKPLERQMMAAMAQLDCGSCGYLCKTYAEAIATGREKNLTLCTPGGTATAKLLRNLNKQRDVNGKCSSPDLTSDAPAWAPTLTAMAGTRENPVKVKLVASQHLNGPRSAKDTRHIAIDLGDTGLGYNVGDALGVFPTNCDQLIRDVCQAANINPDEIVQEDGLPRALSEVLRERCLRSITS
jgi:sulfite reductase (NADPH) flavoprotein alpha-component